MTRGDVVLVSVSGDYGKPRPALVVQTNAFSSHPSVTVCLITSHMQQTPLYRYEMDPTPENGLAIISQAQIDKLMTIPRGKIGQVIGRLTDKQMTEITRLLAFWVGAADV